MVVSVQVDSGGGDEDVGDVAYVGDVGDVGDVECTGRLRRTR